jgi:FtsZ-binding cell division protein ZapB
MLDFSNPAIIVAISGVISVLTAIVGTYYATTHTAKKDALTIAQEDIAKLSARIDLYVEEIKKLRIDYDSLWNTLKTEREEWNKQTKAFNDEIESLKKENASLKERLTAYIKRCECKEGNSSTINDQFSLRREEF